MDAVFQVYSTNPCGGSGTSINCTNANGAGITETTTLTGLTIGGQYWIRVYDAGTGIPACGTFSICIQTPPTNDDCVNAIMLTPNATCVPTTGNVNVASSSGVPVSSTCSTSNPDDDVWYYFVATGTCHIITVSSSASFDPGFEVFDGTCGGLTSILCNAPGGNPGTTITSVINTIIGNVYHVRVYDYGAGYPATTTFTICVLNCLPTNDNCGGAITLTPITATCVMGANELVGDDSGATQTLVGCSGNANDDVWYQFTTNATANQPYCITVVGSAVFDAVFQVFSTSCGGTSLACINATGAGGTETTTLITGVQLAPSSQYWIRVYDSGAGYPAITTFTICISNCAPVGINETYNEPAFTIAPNPFTSQTIISFNEQQKNTSISLRDVIGKEIKTINFSGKEFILEKGNLEKGIYFIQIGNSKRKIVIN